MTGFPFLSFVSCFFFYLFHVSLTHTPHHIYFLIKFTSRTIETPPKETTIEIPPKKTTIETSPKETTIETPLKETTIETPPKKATPTTNPYQTPEKRIPTTAAKSTSTKLFNMTKSPMTMNDREIEVFNISNEDLVVPEKIDIHNILFYQEPGHSIADGTKKMDKLCLQVPVHDPEDYNEKRYGVVVNKAGRIFVKVPRHSAAASNSLDLYDTEYKSGIADGHKEYATRTKEYQRDGKKDELFNIFALDVPFKCTTQYNVKQSSTLCSSTWAGEDIYMADQQLKVVWKKLSGETDIAILFLVFSIGIEDSIRDIELSTDKDVIDTFSELSILAQKRKTKGTRMYS